MPDDKQGNGRIAGNWKVSKHRLVAQVSQVLFGVVNGRPDEEHVWSEP